MRSPPLRPRRELRLPSRPGRVEAMRACRFAFMRFLAPRSRKLSVSARGLLRFGFRPRPWTERPTMRCVLSLQIGLACHVVRSRLSLVSLLGKRPFYAKAIRPWTGTPFSKIFACLLGAVSLVFRPVHLRIGAIAQLVERLNGIQKVRSSTLLSSTKVFDKPWHPGRERDESTRQKIMLAKARQ